MKPRASRKNHDVANMSPKEIKRANALHRKLTRAIEKDIETRRER